MTLIVKQALPSARWPFPAAQVQHAQRVPPLAHEERDPESDAPTVILSHMASSVSDVVSQDESARELELEEAISRLPPIDREILWLRHSAQLSNREVAQRLGIEQKVASRRYVSALVRLKDVIGGIRNSSSNNCDRPN